MRRFAPSQSQLNVRKEGKGGNGMRRRKKGKGNSGKEESREGPCTDIIEEQREAGGRGGRKRRTANMPEICQVE